MVSTCSLLTAPAGCSHSRTSPAGLQVKHVMPDLLLASSALVADRRHLLPASIPELPVTVKAGRQRTRTVAAAFPDAQTYRRGSVLYAEIGNNGQIVLGLLYCQ